MNSRYPDLRARVEALGLQIFFNVDDDHGVTDYFVNDPETDCVVCTSTDGDKDLLDFLDAAEKNGLWWKRAADTSSDKSAPLEPPIENPIRAFLLATVNDSCYCSDDKHQRGRTLVEAMAAAEEASKDDSNPTLPLSAEQCADVLWFLCGRECLNGDVQWGARSIDEIEKKYGGWPGFGLYLVVHHVGNQLRREGREGVVHG